jgi:hypothetical protein
MAAGGSGHSATARGEVTVSGSGGGSGAFEPGGLNDVAISAGDVAAPAATGAGGIATIAEGGAWTAAPPSDVMRDEALAAAALGETLWRTKAAFRSAPKPR